MIHLSRELEETNLECLKVCCVLFKIILTYHFCKFDFLIQEAPEKRVLVLGLDGAGKSSLLQHMNSGDSASALQPTNGFSVISIQNEGVALNIWEGKFPSIILVE